MKFATKETLISTNFLIEKKAHFSLDESLSVQNILNICDKTVMFSLKN